MKPSFHHKPLGGPYDDPVVFVRFLREKRAMLFDCGSLDALSPGDIQKITDVFVTHTHIDHFIGFDTLLRALLFREIPLCVYGPETIIEAVEGKLRGYAWNLISEYPFRLEVYALGEHSIRHVSFHAADGLVPHDNGTIPFDGTLLQGDSFRVRAERLAHGITSLGFSLEEDFHININKDALEKMGLSVGPWLRELKRLIRSGAHDDTMLETDMGSYRLGEIRSLASIARGQKVSYIADSSPGGENIMLIKELVSDSDTLYCEAYFLDRDMEAAVHRNHLTGKLAGRIAREAGVRELVPLHFSPRYSSETFTPGDEALREFVKNNISA